ncbi:MAG: glycosyltransferase family 2 protein [Balneolaceae bacterium]|nr:MAG: glycosyltransferase family 2 protein [Balneolaceae bacterium]
MKQPELMKQAESKSGRIAVLLSTCNGAGYLVPLLESIQDQSWPHWDLWVRDDGSTDDTVEILEEFAGRLAQKNQPGTGSRMQVIRGENIGIVRSFFHLLGQAGDAYAGYAFCDQDDVWHPAKLERAVRALKREVPFLYHGRQWLVDQESGEKILSPVPKRTGFANALIQNQVVGCTMVINTPLRECVLETLQAGSEDDPSSGDNNHCSGDGDPCSGIIMHDWWCYLLASATGHIHYDPEPVILFRRHEESTTPVATSSFRIIRKRLSALRKRDWSVGHIMHQARVLQRHFTQVTIRADSNLRCRLSDSDMQLLHSLINLQSATFFGRIGYLFAGEHTRIGKIDTAIFRLLVLFKRF